MMTNSKTKKVKGWAVLRYGMGEHLGMIELDYEAKGDNREPNLAYSIHPTRKFAKMSQDDGDKVIPCTISYSLPKKKSN